MQTLTIGKLAATAGVGVDTVRLRFVRRAKGLGFSLEEVGELLRLNDGRGTRASVRALTERRLAQIEQRLVELNRMRKTLHGLLHDCHGDGPLAGCPIIEAVLAD